MSTWVNAADHDCTLAYVPILFMSSSKLKKLHSANLATSGRDRSRPAALESSGFFGFSAFNADGETLH